MGTVVALGGQVGGAKLADGLYRLRGRDLTLVVNTGDDYEHLGLAFSPDLDTAVYTLAGMAGAEAGWEPAGETRSLQGMLKALGGPEQPPLGDKSLAAPLLRTQGLAAGRRLTEITLDFCRHLGVAARVLPMSDDPVRTHVLTDDGAIPFPEYFGQLACGPRARGLEYAGADQARISDEVLDALHSADLDAVVICPSNPYHVIRPILEISGMRELLLKRGAPVIAVTPIVGGKALKGSAGKMMRDLGKEVSPRAIVGEYLRLIDGFVIDKEDEALADDVRSLGIHVLTAPTVMRTVDDRVALARAVLNFAFVVREAIAMETD
ncbi:MAG TPA: 2-phospho-L-lactate transferase CofD family protein [Burkholderiales bacterium]|nr:2-phospho-L-lactate transferase CofD family protein [Burkholderiales bacterium]